MDYHNNSVGLSFAREASFPRKNGLQMDQSIINAFYKALEEGKLMDTTYFTGPACCFSAPNS